MPIPADVVRRKLKKQIKGLSQEDRIRLLQQTLDELPGYTSGPYGRLKNWIKQQMQGAQKQREVVHQESFMVRKQGDCTAALVGAPNCGKSSLLQSLTGRQVRIGSYPYTTLKPVDGMLKMHGAYIQLVEIPGLLAGAAQGKGDGPAFLSALRAADVAVFVGALTDWGFEQFCDVCSVVEQAGIDLPRLIAVSKADMDGADRVADRYRQAFGQYNPVEISVKTTKGLDDLRSRLWQLTGLMRVFPRVPGESSDDAIILGKNSTVRDFAAAIHGQLAGELARARVWGSSAKFPGQTVPADHKLQDGDTVQLRI